MRVWLAVFATIAIVLVVAAVFRLTLAEAAVRRALAASGFPEAEFRVATFGLNEASVRELSLGPDLPTAGRVALSYRPLDLLLGSIKSIRIEDAAASLDGLRTTMDRLRAPTGDETTPSPEPSLPETQIAAARILLDDPVWGAGEAVIDGEAAMRRGALTARFIIDLDADWASGRATIETETLDAAAAPIIDLNGRIEAELAPLGALLGAPISAGRATTSVSGRGSVEFGDAATLAELLAAFDGSATIAVDASEIAARLAETADGPVSIEAGAATLRLALAAADGAARATLVEPARLTAERATVPAAWAIGPAPTGAIGPIDLRLSVEEDGAALLSLVATEDDVVSLDAAPHAALTLGAGEAPATARLAARIDASGDDARALLEGAGAWLRLDAEAWRVGAVSSIDAQLDAALEIANAGRTASFSGGGAASGDVDVSLGAAIDGFAVAGPIDGALTVTEAFDGLASWRLALRSTDDDPASLAIDRLAIPDIAATRSETRVAVDAAALAGDANGLTLQTAGTLAPVDASAPEGREAIRFDQIAGAFSLDLTLPADGPISGRLQASDAALVAPEIGVALSDVEADVPISIGDRRREGAVSARLADLARPARFAPARLTLDIVGEGPEWRGDGAARIASLRAPIAARYDAGAARGRARLGPTTLAFADGRLQPGDLSPAFGRGVSATGDATLSATLRTAPGRPIDGAADLAIDRLSLRLPAGSVDRLSGAIALTALNPPATDGAAMFSADRVVVGAPLNDVEARVAIEPAAGGAAARIEWFSGAMAGGRVVIEDAAIPLSDAPFAFAVDVQSVDFARLIEEWSISGLKGEGVLSGRLPIRVGGGDVVVQDGAIAAEGPGVVQVDWGDARQPLASQGQQVDLLVRALEDFRYETLSIGVERPLAGELGLAVSMGGANPTVLDGHPFQFNINLEGELEKILAAIREGQTLGSNLIQGGLTR